MPSSPGSGSIQKLSLFGAARAWWIRESALSGTLTATRKLSAALFDFARNSTPSRLRQRFGDVDYDWDHRVNTTRAGVGWRDRLLAVFHSPYQPTEPLLFKEMLEELQRQANFDFGDFTFLDLGSGKGRTLLMASDYPFKRILGVELLPSLDRIAEENLRSYKNESQRCFALESLCADATKFPIPNDPLVLYLFNPFPESGLREVLANLRQSLDEHARPVYVLYHNPLLEYVLHEVSGLTKVSATHQYSLFSNQGV